MNNGNLIIKVSGRETVSLSTLSKVCSCLTNILNKISMTVYDHKGNFNVMYNTHDGFSLNIIEESSSNNLVSNDVNVLNIFVDILAVRRFVLKAGNFTVASNDEYVEVNNGIVTETYSHTAYNIYTSDNVIEDNLAKISSILVANKCLLQVTYKNGILSRKVNYTKEELATGCVKKDIESLVAIKEEYNSSMSLKVEQLDLLGKGTWKFKDISNAKSGSFKAKIDDKEFTKQLKSGNVIIGYGLILKSEVKTTIYKDKSGKIIPGKSTYLIEKVNDVLYSNQVDETTLAI